MMHGPSTFNDAAMLFHSVLFTYYVKELRRLLHGPRALLSFALASAMHAIGQALVALVGSALALSLATHIGASSALPFSGVHVGSAKSAESQAFFLSLVGLAVVLVKGAAGAHAAFVQVRVAGEVGAALRLGVFDAFLSFHRIRDPRQSDQGSHVGPPTRALLTLTDRVRDVELGLSDGLLSAARSVAQLIPLALLLVLLAPRMAIVAAALLGIFGWLLGRLRRGYREATRRAICEHERLVEAMDDSVRHAELWVTYGAEGKARANVDKLGMAVARGCARLEARAVVLSGANEVLGALALAGAMGASRAGWIGPTGGATLLAFGVAFFQAYRPLRELAEARLALARAQSAYGEIMGTLGRVETATHATPARPAPDRPWPLAALELRNLRLARGACPPITARVPAGAVAVVVGRTGSGKTTLLRTLLGLESATGGEVTFDGVSLGDAPAGPRARPFAWVPQDSPLLADSLEVNVGLGASAGHSLDALVPFGASHLVAALREDRLGVGGRIVSGGERQWIALARAVATRQPVLLLDEPTSGLDAASQRVVLEAIERLRGQRTVVIVTHRPEAMAIADLVVRLDEPRLRPDDSERRPDVDDYVGRIEHLAVEDVCHRVREVEPE
jgi:ABC-type multidrug transport system fused ATPase/permease subunit